jgi:hypothetical protein
MWGRFKGRAKTVVLVLTGSHAAAHQWADGRHMAASPGFFKAGV